MKVSRDFQHDDEVEKNIKRGRKVMSKQSGTTDSVYKVVEVIGASTKSWEDAAKKCGGNRVWHAARPANCRGCEAGHEGRERQGKGVSHARAVVLQVRELRGSVTPWRGAKFEKAFSPRQKKES